MSKLVLAPVYSPWLISFLDSNTSSFFLLWSYWSAFQLLTGPYFNQVSPSHLLTCVTLLLNTRDVVNATMSVCNLVTQSVCFLLFCRWVMRSSTCASKASLWTGSLRAMCYPARKTSAIVSSAAWPGRKFTCRPHRFTTSRRNLTCVGTQHTVIWVPMGILKVLSLKLSKVNVLGIEYMGLV